MCPLTQEQQQAALADLQERLDQFWEKRSTQFAMAVQRRPEHVQSALGDFEKDLRTKGLAGARSLESFVLERAPEKEKLACAGGAGKRLTYKAARQFVRHLHNSWEQRVDEYNNIGDFAEDASKWIQEIMGVQVTPATVRQWLKQMRLTRPRLAA